MAKSKKKSLTDPKTEGIVLTTNEERILTNLRRIARRNEYGTLTAVIDYHEGTLSKGRVINNELKL